MKKGDTVKVLNVEEWKGENWDVKKGDTGKVTEIIDDVVVVYNPKWWGDGCISFEKEQIVNADIKLK